MLSLPSLVTDAPNHFAYQAAASSGSGTLRTSSSVEAGVGSAGSSVRSTLTFSGDRIAAFVAVAPGSGRIPSASSFDNASRMFLTLMPIASATLPTLLSGGGTLACTPEGDVWAGGVAGAAVAPRPPRPLLF